MKQKKLWISLVLCFVFFSTDLSAHAKEQSDWVKLQMHRTLDALAHTIETAYAPMEWKYSRWGWELESELRTIYSRLDEAPLSIAEFRYLLKDLFASAKDHHLSIFFYATERAELPLKIRQADGIYCLSAIDRSWLPKEQFPLVEGDELLFFDQMPIQKAIDSLKIELKLPLDATGQALAEQALTCRKAALGHRVPKGDVMMTVRQQKNGKTVTFQLPWLYTPEEIPTPPLKPSLTAKALEQEPNASWLTELTSVSEEHLDPWEISSRYTYTPKLGHILWESDASWSVHAYLFQTPSGKRYSYLRIPHFHLPSSAMRELENVIDFFEKQSNGLVIDLVNNPGGSLLTVYAIASLLTDYPLIPPQHAVKLHPKEINRAVKGLALLSSISSDKSAQETIGQRVEGYPVTAKFAQQMQDYFQLILEQWSAGERLTKPCAYLGIDQVMPHATIHYTKPILVLTNALCFSGADFFAALMQDNGRAKLFGEQTAGAGGAMMEVSFPNLFGIQSCHLTITLAQRKDQQFIENVGITPDISYCLTRDDLTRHHTSYAATIIEALEKIK